MMNGDLIPPNEKETGRLEAFSDGIFAIAITLLGLTLQVPDLGEDVSAAALAEALGQQWPSYIAFAISFFTILIVWLNHHAVFGLVRMADFLFLLANGFLLMLVTVVPITTEVATRDLGTPAASAATAVYAGTLFMVTVFHNLLWLSATYNRRLLKPSTPESFVRVLTRNYLLGLPLYVTAIVLAFWNVYLSLGLCTLLWLIWREQLLPLLPGGALLLVGAVRVNPHHHPRHVLTLNVGDGGAHHCIGGRPKPVAG